MEKKYCCLCNTDMEQDENKERQEWFFPTDGFERWYCSKCSEKAESIEREYIDRANNLRAKHEYYNPLDLIMMVENLYVNRNTNLGVYFDMKNNEEYIKAEEVDEEIIKAINTVRDYCRTHEEFEDCRECVLGDGIHDCGCSSPFMWKIRKRGK